MNLIKTTYRKILSVLPDKLANGIIFFRGYKKIMNLKHPVYLGEKIQWLKMNGNMEELSIYVDKYEVRSFVKNTIGKEYLINIFGVYDNVEDIDFDKKILRINKTVYTITRNGRNEAYIDKPKTKQSNRMIPLPKQLISVLKRNKRKSTSSYIITTKNGGIVQNRSYQKSFKCILKKCNITYKSFHSLRHTFATRVLELGMDIKTLSEILGHKNSMITLNRYSHSLLEHKFDFMNKIGKLLDIYDL